MSVQQTIEADYKTAFKSSDKNVVSALRMLKSAIKNREIDLVRELTDDETIEIISREMKRRHEAIAQYQAAGRPELAAHEQADATVYAKYLPAPLTEDELAAIVGETVKALGATSVQQLGKVMGAVMAKVKGRADGTAVQAVAKRVLGAK
jgi:hypothetical protein